MFFCAAIDRNKLLIEINQKGMKKPVDRQEKQCYNKFIS